VLGTLAWIALVRWRLRSHPAGLWRGTALSAGGLITTWLLLATLWMPALDYVRSYRDVSASLASALDRYRQPGECVRTQGLGSGQRASFLVFNGIEFSFDGNCPLLLQQISPRSLASGEAWLADHPALWEGRREPDRHEMFRLLRLKP
ncbi:MAG: glycosyltransferase, partial [Castellaniella sp.]